jgi:hypothetical protein
MIHRFPPGKKLEQNDPKIVHVTLLCQLTSHSVPALDKTYSSSMLVYDDDDYKQYIKTNDVSCKTTNFYNIMQVYM